MPPWMATNPGAPQLGADPVDQIVERVLVLGKHDELAVFDPTHLIRAKQAPQFDPLAVDPAGPDGSCLVHQEFEFDELGLRAPYAVAETVAASISWSSIDSSSSSA